MPTELDKLRFCAKYPFTEEARKYLQNVNLNEISYDKVQYAYDYIVELTTKANDEFFKKQFTEIGRSQKEFLINEIMLYPISKIVAGIMGGSLKYKYAKTVAKKTYQFLQLEKETESTKIAKELFLFDGNKMHFTEFLKYSLNDEELKLAYFELSDGFVLLDDKTIRKLISQYAFRKAMEDIDKKKIPKEIIAYVEKIKTCTPIAAFNTKEIGEFGAEDTQFFPPCIRKILAELKSGEKVGHIPRFVLSTFFANANMPIEEATKYFQSQPNFNEKKTRYYLEHSYGLKGGTKYSVPACAKVSSYGLCARDTTCVWRHPLEYYSRKKGAVKKAVDVKQVKE